MQLFTDLVLSKDGRLKGPRRSPGDTQHVELVLTCPNLEMAGSYELPRLAGVYPLLLTLQAFLDVTQPGMQVESTIIGKPERASFEYAENVLRE